MEHSVLKLSQKLKSLIGKCGPVLMIFFLSDYTGVEAEGLLKMKEIRHSYMLRKY